MTAHHIPQGQNDQAQALSLAVGRFLDQNQDALVTLLRLIQEPDAAERIAALPTGLRIAPSRVRNALADLTEAERCLAEAPVQLDSLSAPGWSDLDAALRWMGARLSELIQPDLRHSF